jgi:hypothetical protein
MPDSDIEGMRVRPFSPLPESLARGPFNLTEAWPTGLSRGRARSGDLEAPYWGVRRQGIAATFLDRVRAADQIRAVDEAFSHHTAARLLGLPLPRPWEDIDPVHICGETELPRLRRAGVVSHRGLERRLVVTAHGMPCTDPLTTWADLAGVLTLDDLVVIGDVLIRRGSGLAPADLRRMTLSRARRRGVRRMRDALVLVRVGSASPMETRARLVFARGALPEPELNATVCDEAGGWLATGDFVWREKKVVAEFDGDYHRTDRRQWQLDVGRRESVQASGWTYVQLTARSVTDPGQADSLVRRLRGLLLGAEGPTSALIRSE